MPEQLPRVMYITSYPVDPTGPITGPQRVMRDVIRRINAKGADVEVWSVPYRRVGRRHRNLIDDGVSIHFVGPLAVVAAALRNPGDVMHIGSFSLFHTLPFIVRLLLARFLKTGPVVYTAHGVVAIEARFGARVVPLLTPWVERLLVTRSDHIVVLSKQMADLIINRYRIPAKRVEVIGPAVPSAFEDLESVVSDTLVADPRFIYAGEFRDVKGLDTLARALVHLHHSDPQRPWALIVAGAPAPSWEPPPGWRELLDHGRIQRLGVLSTGDLADAYASALCLVLPSRYEPYGMVVLEAMACGTAVIISDRVGARDLIDDDVSGLVIPYGDDAAWSGALSLALDDPGRFVTMGAEARSSVHTRSTVDVAERYLDAYQS